MELMLSPAGADRYMITGSRRISGWVLGKVVHFETTELINHLVWDGTVDSPTTMSGKFRPSLMLGASCDWWARKS